MEQNRMLYEKNVAVNSHLKMGVELAKTKNLYKKKCLSSAVRGELIDI